jgi:hypothetical protein
MIPLTLDNLPKQIAKFSPGVVIQNENNDFLKTIHHCMVLSHQWGIIEVGLFSNPEDRNPEGPSKEPTILTFPFLPKKLEELKGAGVSIYDPRLDQCLILTHFVQARESLSKN